MPVTPNLVGRLLPFRLNRAPGVSLVVAEVPF